MTTEQKIIRAKVGLLELAKQLGNVSQACKMMGYSRDSFYCRIWYSTSRTVSDDDVHRLTLMTARSALSQSSPRFRSQARAFRAPLGDCPRAQVLDSDARSLAV